MRRRPPRRALRSALAAAVVLLVAGCKPDTVRLTFRPALGRSFRYVTTITASTTTTLEGHAPVTNRDVATLHSDQRILSDDRGQLQVQIVVTRPGSDPRTYLARYDRAAQLTAVERVEGIPTEALGDLGLTEIIPAAAGAPPDKGLRPGDTWRVDQQVQLPGTTAPVALQGEGRLVELGVLDGRRTARVRSSTHVPLKTEADPSTTLEGTQTTDLDALYDVDDGAVVEGTAHTVGHFTVELRPPAGQPGTPVHGTLTVEIQTTIKPG